MNGMYTPLRFMPVWAAGEGSELFLVPRQFRKKLIQDF